GPQAGVPTASPPTPLRVPSTPGIILVAELAPTDLPVGPELPTAVDLTPTDVPWASGDTVTIAGAEGANLRPYPIADDELAGPSFGLRQGAEVQIVSTFRLRMSDGNWWYVRIPGSAEGVAPTFGWIREDLVQPPEATAATR